MPPGKVLQLNTGFFKLQSRAAVTLKPRRGQKLTGTADLFGEAVVGRRERQDVRLGRATGERFLRSSSPQ